MHTLVEQRDTLYIKSELLQKKKQKNVILFAARSIRILYFTPHSPITLRPIFAFFLGSSSSTLKVGTI